MNHKNYVDLETLSRSVAAEVQQFARDCMRRDGRFSVALSGGSTPKRLYELMTQLDIDWNRTHVFFGDERAVPPTSEKSNYKLAHDTLLSKVKIPAGQVHRLEGESKDLAAAAKAADATLREFGTIDLQLLGIGDDGHTASLFPGGPWLDEKSKLVVPSRAPVEPQDRLTMTLPALTQSREVWFLAEGAKKRPMVERALAKDITIPSGMVASKAASVSFFTALPRT